MDKNELALVIEAQAEQAVKQINILLAQFNTIINNIQIIKTNIKSSTTIVNNYFNAMDKGATNANKSANGLKGSLSKLGGVLIRVLSIRKLAQILTNSAQEMMNYTETLNLFNTALAESSEQGTKFQNKMNEIFGTNKEEMMKYQGLFTGIAHSLGLGTEASYKLGEGLTSLSIDLSSLHNKDIKQVNEALKSGLVGQTKPVRSLGMDITERTLDNELKLMGITDRSVATMSQTEKVIMRYNTMLKQSAVAHGDWAKTIEAPANQMRILKNQLVELQRWIGAVFYGTLSSVLPYINAFAMVLKEVIKSLAVMMGYKPQTFGGAMYEDTGIEDFNSGLDDANDKAKELKKQLFGFDEINNISTDSGKSGKDGGAGTGVDPRLLDSIKEYEATMENVRMKATSIRDKIMDWLGYTKKVNSETGETYFTLDEGYQKIELIIDILKALIKTLLLYKSIKAFNNILKELTTFWGTLTIIAAKISSFFSAIYGFLELLAFCFGTTVAVVVAVIAAIIAATVLIVVFREEIWNFLKKVAGYIASAVSSTATFFKNIGKGIYDFFYGIVQAIYKFLSPIFSWIYDTLIKPILDIIISIGKTIYDVISTVIGNIIKIIGKMIETITKVGEMVWALATIFFNAFGKVVSFIYNNVLSPIFDGFKWVFGQIWDFVGGIISKIINAFVSITTVVYDKVIKPIFNFFKKLVEDVSGFFFKIAQTIADTISGVVKAALNVVFGLIEGIVNGFVKAINGAIKIINVGLPKDKEIGKLDKLKIDRLASGGFPELGSMFIAREAGPEMVGTIGNRTAVVNNDQIVSAVSQGVAQAVSSVIGNGGAQSFAFYLDGDRMTDTVVKKINSQIQQYGTSPLRG